MKGHLKRFKNLDMEVPPSLEEISEFGAKLLSITHRHFMDLGHQHQYQPVPRKNIRFREKQRVEAAIACVEDSGEGSQKLPVIVDY
jgi:hypothetical protein